MKENIFSFSDYKAFIRHLTRIHKPARGYQGQMANAAGCPRSYFSRVLNSKAHLSSEQALKLADFWSLPDTESEYFLELLAMAKTDFPPLIKRIKKRLEKLRLEVANLSTRFKETTMLDRDKERVYYGAWFWSAIHLLVGISGFQTIETISQRLNLPPTTVKETLSKLELMGLVKWDGKKWTRAPAHSHLSKDSPMIGIHHLNWRQRAIENSFAPGRDELHYTLVQTHSQEDLERIKQTLLSSIDKCREIMLPSANEELTCLCLDFFRV
jgi:uncharacterized protein (TIGR02147 family)